MSGDSSPMIIMQAAAHMALALATGMSLGMAIGHAVSPNGVGQSYGVQWAISAGLLSFAVLVRLVAP